MPEPAIDFIAHDYPFFRHVTGLRDGLDLRYVPVALGMAFKPVLDDAPFQVNEFSLANYTMLRDAGDDRMLAIPVFLNRDFRQGSLYVRRDSDLEHPSQLRGKTVGAREYTQTAGVWWRGTVLDEHGLDWRDIDWVSGPDQRFPPPAEAAVRIVDGDLEALVADGAIDGLLAPLTRDEAKPEAERRLRPIYRDAPAAERDYYARTGIFPINHAVVIRRDWLDRHPGLAKAVFDACCDSKRTYYAEAGIRDPWGAPAEDDPIPFGLTPKNREIVETLARYLHEQKFIGQMPDIGSLFVEDAPGWSDA